MGSRKLRTLCEQNPIFRACATLPRIWGFGVQFGELDKLGIWETYTLGGGDELRFEATATPAGISNHLQINQSEIDDHFWVNKDELPAVRGFSWTFWNSSSKVYFKGNFGAPHSKSFKNLGCQVRVHPAFQLHELAICYAVWWTYFADLIKWKRRNTGPGMFILSTDISSKPLAKPGWECIRNSNRGNWI